MKRWKNIFLIDGRVCPSWFSFTLTAGPRRLMHDPQRIFSGMVRPGDTAIDIGCGPGFFTVPLARMVGEQGRVFAVDIQEKMLDRLRGRLGPLGLSGRVIPCRCSEENLGLEEKADFIVTFWMVHEVPDPGQLFRQIVTLMKPGARYLLSEPKFHVSAGKFRSIIAAAEGAGLKPAGEPLIAMSRSVLYDL